MSLINKEVEDFAVQAFVNGEFKKITKADIMGKWTVFFFYPADFTFVCPTELEDLQYLRTFKYEDLTYRGTVEFRSCCTQPIPDGKIVAYEVNSGNVGRNADELFRKIQALQFVREHGDEVCPAKWQPGAETLKPSLDLVGLL